MALVLCLSLCACGDGKAEVEGKPTESSELKVGDTAKGQLFDITIQSVEPVEKIENGFVRHMWSPAEKTNYQDITAEEGYSIVKITYSYSYNGKEGGEFGFDLTLDYDNGYMFDGFGGHALPTIDSGTKVGFEEYYDTGVLGSFAVDDPLTFKGAEAFKYIIVNNEVLSNTDASKGNENGSQYGSTVGTVTLIYENENGEEFQQETTFETVVNRPIVQLQQTDNTEDEEQKAAKLA